MCEVWENQTLSGWRAYTAHWGSRLVLTYSAMKFFSAAVGPRFAVWQPAHWLKGGTPAYVPSSLGAWQSTHSMPAFRACMG
jgi:hypothetical protein